MRRLRSRRLQFGLAAPLLRLEVQRVAKFAQANDLRAQGAAVDGRIQLYGFSQRPQQAEQWRVAILGAAGGSSRSGCRRIHTDGRGIAQRVRGRSEQRRVGTERDSTGRSRWGPSQSQKKT